MAEVAFHGRLTTVQAMCEHQMPTIQFGTGHPNHCRSLPIVLGAGQRLDMFQANPKEELDLQSVIHAPLNQNQTRLQKERLIWQCSYVKSRVE